MADENLKKLKQSLRQKDIEVRELKKLTTKDPLTGLYNRRGFEEEAGRLFKDIAFAKEHAETREHFHIDSFTVLFFDIDNFKKLNDTHGHKAGDQILQYVSGIIKQKVRGIDIAGRWGGEELVVALVGSREADASAKAEEIRKTIRSRVKIPGHKDLKITVSVGVAELDGAAALGEIIKRADEAMYVAKTKRGKDNVVKYSELRK